MKKKKIIYSLTSRGLYSEIFNLLLAIVYAKLKGQDFIINTFQWNARMVLGWEDYFEPTIKNINNIFSSQYQIYTEKIWIGKLYYNPIVFFRFYFFLVINKLFLFLNPHVEFSSDVFVDLRSNPYFISKNNEILKENMSNVLKKIYRYNKKTSLFISEQRKSLNLPNSYIGVHIRRGDKISTCEMQKIDINRYVSEIISHRDLSRNVYIATDDETIIATVKSKLKEYDMNIYFNLNIKQNGFVEDMFNKKNKNERYFDTLNTLLDVDILSKSVFFIGTYSSNLSRIIPLLLGFEKCISLDIDWGIS